MSSQSNDHQKDRSQIKGMITRRISRSIKYETINTLANRMPAGVLHDTDLNQAASKKKFKGNQTYSYNLDITTDE